MQDNIGHMESSRLRSVEGSIQLQGQPRERVPIGAIECRKSPLNVGDCQPGLNVIVAGDVKVVVVIGEAGVN